MAVQIKPTGKAGQQLRVQKQVKQVAEAVASPEAWSAMSANQRWEVVRKVIAHLLRHEFDQ